MTQKLCIVTTLKANINEINEFINYHLNIGIDHIILFFDDPNDKNIDLLLPTKKISTIACTPNHWLKLGCTSKSKIEIRQKANANFAISLALKLGMNWLSHIDIDELIYSPIPLQNIFYHIPKDTSYIWLKPYEVIPHSFAISSPFKQLNQFKILSEHRINKLKKNANKEELARILFLGEYFRGHTGGKSIVNISNNNQIQCLGIHKPTFIDNNIIKVFNNKALHLLHYDCYDFNNWKTKWTRRYDKSAAFNGRKNRKEQFNEFIAAYQTGSIEKMKELYRRHYILSTKDKKLLSKYALIKEINIKKQLFSSI